MERWLKNVEVWCWTKRHPFIALPPRQDWNLICTASAIDLLLKCLTILNAEGPGSRRTLPVRAGTPWNRNEAVLSAEKLQLRFTEPTPELRQMHLRGEERSFVCEMTPLGLVEFSDALEDYRGRDDFAVGPRPDLGRLGTLDRKSAPLWFWHYTTKEMLIG